MEYSGFIEFCRDRDWKKVKDVDVMILVMDLGCTMDEAMQFTERFHREDGIE